jgi:hypothetical protein
MELNTWKGFLGKEGAHIAVGYSEGADIQISEAIVELARIRTAVEASKHTSARKSRRKRHWILPDFDEQNSHAAPRV